ncbi:hypothetical protein NIIDMKKI_02870 [Mycobacterium kansasii]|uniref:Aminotransferase n=1 Tax=Mycobacterium kansasii TaxID=1768 RepID=A0A7G1I1Z3_MYCKA|nr:hypothetical protein NIIDMKKI_02870 [Mycobacterium kansasii]
MTHRVARRAGIPPFHVMDVWLAAAERQRTHGDLVNLSAGQPSAGAPEPVRAAAAAALHLNQLGYTVALGIPELRAAIAADYERQHGITVGPDAVVVTTGSSGGFLLTFLACFDVGDRVAMASPGYPCYRNILSALGCEVVEIPCGPATRFQPTVQMLAELDPPVQGLVVASPANPTGTVIPPAELSAIASWCDESRVRLVSDEVYHGLVYEGAPQTSCAWQTSRNAVVVNSFSKYYAMTGWRLGWLLVPTELRRAVDCLTGNFTICPPVLSQIAAVSAFTPRRPQKPTTICGTMRSTARCCSTACVASGLTGWHPPTARSTSTPMSRTSPPTRWPSARGCWPTPVWRSHQAWTSTLRGATRLSGCRSPGRPATSKKLCAECGPGCRAARCWAGAQQVPR